jgi:hypothetical protein
MKKQFLVCLMLLAGSAWAEWVIYAENDVNSFYFDPATLRKDGNMRRGWELTNYKQRDKYGSISSRSRCEYDCKYERFRILTISEHSEPMARGSVTRQQYEGGPWADIPPDTISEKLFKVVCYQN